MFPHPLGPQTPSQHRAAKINEKHHARQRSFHVQSLMVPVAVEDGPLPLAPLHRAGANSDGTVTGNLQSQVGPDAAGTHVLMVWLDVAARQEDAVSPSCHARQIFSLHSSPELRCHRSHLQVLPSLVAPQGHGIHPPALVPLERHEPVLMVSPQRQPLIPKLPPIQLELLEGRKLFCRVEEPCGVQAER